MSPTPIQQRPPQMPTWSSCPICVPRLDPDSDVHCANRECPSRLPRIAPPRPILDCHAVARRKEATARLQALAQRRSSPPADAGPAAPAGAAIRAPSTMATTNAYGPRSRSIAQSLTGAL